MKPIADIMGSNNAALVDMRDHVDKSQILKDQRFIVMTPTRGDQEFTCKCGEKYKLNLGIHPNVVMCWQILDDASEHQALPLDNVQCSS